MYPVAQEDGEVDHVAHSRLDDRVEEREAEGEDEQDGGHDEGCEGVAEAVNAVLVVHVADHLRSTCITYMA